MTALTKVAQNTRVPLAHEDLTTGQKARAVQKLGNRCLALDVPIHWDPSRVVTPGSLCGYKTGKELRFITFDATSRVKLFKQHQESQGLLFERSQVVAASVTTAIKTETACNKETKGTFVQYDKERVQQQGADFVVAPKNHKDQVNYQGGHLIDHEPILINSLEIFWFF